MSNIMSFTSVNTPGVPMKMDHSRSNPQKVRRALTSAATPLTSAATPLASAASSLTTVATQATPKDKGKGKAKAKAKESPLAPAPATTTATTLAGTNVSTQAAGIDEAVKNGVGMPDRLVQISKDAKYIVWSHNSKKDATTHLVVGQYVTRSGDKKDNIKNLITGALERYGSLQKGVIELVISKWSEICARKLEPGTAGCWKTFDGSVRHQLTKMKEVGLIVNDKNLWKLAPRGVAAEVTAENLSSGGVAAEVTAENLSSGGVAAEVTAENLSSDGVAAEVTTDERASSAAPSTTGSNTSKGHSDQYTPPSSPELAPVAKQQNVNPSQADLNAADALLLLRYGKRNFNDDDEEESEHSARRQRV